MLGVLLAMVACGRASTTSKAQGPATEAPALAAVTADQVLQKVREPGAKAVVINVWATWCTPCREEFPTSCSFVANMNAEA